MKIQKIIIIYILFSTVFISCATLKDTEQDLGYTVYSDIVYGSDNRHIMDISIPNNKCGKSECNIVYSWRTFNV